MIECFSKTKSIVTFQHRKREKNRLINQTQRRTNKTIFLSHLIQRIIIISKEIKMTKKIANK